MSNFPHNLNPKDYESITDEGRDEEFQESNFQHSHNHKDYESTSDERHDE